MEVCMSFKDVSYFLAGYWISVFVSAPMQNTWRQDIKNCPLYISQVRYEIHSLLEVFYIMALTQKNWQTMDFSNAVQPIWPVEMDCRPVCTCFSVTLRPIRETALI